MAQTACADTSLLSPNATTISSYDAWGNVRVGSQTGSPRARYCANLGHVQDDESGLVYMRARYYEPTSGRFVSEDPGRNGGNWYAYCDNAPSNRVDLSGKLSGDEIAQLGLAFLGFCWTLIDIGATEFVLGAYAMYKHIGEMIEEMSVPTGSIMGGLLKYGDVLAGNMKVLSAAWALAVLGEDASDIFNIPKLLKDMSAVS